MRGEKSILAMRLKNIPVQTIWVFVVDFEELDKSRVFLDPEQMLAYELKPEVLIYPSDAIARLDFRFAVGTTVHLSGTDLNRVLGVQRRIKLFKPHQLFTTANDYFQIYELAEAA